jgi:outer membrane immunogenic protein
VGVATIVLQRGNLGVASGCGMRRLIVAGAIIIAAAGSAFSADLPQPVPGAPKPYAPYSAGVYDWSGLYIGVNAGYGVGTSNWTDPNNPNPAGTPSTGDFTITGFLVGGTVGANFQTGEFVFGVEVDGDGSGIRGTAAPASGFCALTTAALSTATGCQTQNTWMGTARGRIGYAFDRVLVYGTGGLALGNIHAGLTTPGMTTFYDSTAKAGWAAGGGIEYAFADQWSVKVEYLYVDLGNGSCISANCGFDSFNTVTGTLNPANDNVKFAVSTIRGGINFKFPWE